MSTYDRSFTRAYETYKRMQKNNNRYLCRVRGLGGPSAQHVVDGLDDLGHLLLVDDAVAVNVVHSGKENVVLSYFYFYEDYK